MAVRKNSTAHIPAAKGDGCNSGQKKNKGELDKILQAQLEKMRKYVVAKNIKETSNSSKIFFKRC